MDVAKKVAVCLVLMVGAVILWPLVLIGIPAVLVMYTIWRTEEHNRDRYDRDDI